MPDLTCLSCAHYRPSGCAHGMVRWPHDTLRMCPFSRYEPGSDEAEDREAGE